MLRYLVEEYDNEEPTGRAWDVEAPGPTQAATQIASQVQQGSSNCRHLVVKVSRHDQSGTPIYVDLLPSVPGIAANWIGLK